MSRTAKYRTVVYYFPSKLDLLRAVGQELIARMATVLFGALGDDRRSMDDLLRLTWPAVRSPRADPHAALAFEIVGLAGAGCPPFPDLARELSQRFVERFSDRVDSTEDLRTVGAAVLGRLLGLLLIHRIAGETLADATARYEGSPHPADQSPLDATRARAIGGVACSAATPGRYAARGRATHHETSRWTASIVWRTIWV